MERRSVSAALDSRAPVITTLNLAGHSSTPLIEHLNLTRCCCRSRRFCQVLTNQRIVPDHHGTLLFFSRLSHACRRANLGASGTPASAVNVSAAHEIKNQLEGCRPLKAKGGGEKKGKKNQMGRRHLEDLLVSCHVGAILGTLFTFPL